MTNKAWKYIHKVWHRWVNTHAIDFTLCFNLALCTNVGHLALGCRPSLTVAVSYDIFMLPLTPPQQCFILVTKFRAAETKTAEKDGFYLRTRVYFQV